MTFNKWRPYYNRPPRTPDPKFRAPSQEDPAERLHQIPCKFWKYGKCNWGWSCHFLHGDMPEDDPRRPEYRGPPVDFTQFPRPVISSPHFMNSSPMHIDDQNRVHPYRNPVVEVIISQPGLKVQLPSIKDQLQACGIDILYSDAPPMTKEKAAERMNEKLSDFILYIDFSGILLYPGAIPITTVNAYNTIQNEWDFKIINLSQEQLELLNNSEIESILLRIAPDVVDNLNANIVNLQNETANALSSTKTVNCQYGQNELQELHTKLQAFFSKLNILNSMLADIPVYSNNPNLQGTVVQVCPQLPAGMSLPAQKVFSYIIGRSLTQIHLCLSHVHRILNEYKQPRVTFATPTPSIHQTPLCSLNWAVICGEPQVPNIEYGRRLEPEVAVDTPTEYTISFRNRIETGFSPFDPSH